MMEVNPGEMKDPILYTISLCFEWNDFDSCIEFQITVDGEVEDEADLIHELIHGWDSIIQLDDGTIINLSQFKQAYVKNEKGDVKTSKDPIFMRIVH